MISGFLSVRYQFLRPRQHIEERLTLIIDFYHLLGFLQRQADKRTNPGQCRCSRRHARYISEICYLVRQNREGHE